MSTTQVDVIGGTPTGIQTDVDAGLLSSTAYKAPCFTISTTNITLSGLQTINGAVLTEGKRVLVNAQTAGAENGIYVAANGAWSRAPDANSSSDFSEGTQVRVTDGNSPDLYELSTSDPIDLGTTALTFVRVSTTNDMASQVALAGTATTVGVTDLLVLFVGGVLKKITGSDFATWIATLLTAYAPINSPTFTGNPTAPTPAALDNDTSIATTAYVQGEVSPYRDPFLYDQYGAY